MEEEAEDALEEAVEEKERIQWECKALVALTHCTK